MKKVAVDIAIMGSGLSGLTAGITAAEKGAKVAVFEKRPFQGGAVSNAIIMTMAVRNEQEYQDKAFKIHMDYTKWNANPSVVRAWINNSHRTPKFLKDLGIEFTAEIKNPLAELGTKPGYGSGFPPAMHIGDYYVFKPHGKWKGGAIICKKMADRLRTLGGELYLSTPIKRFIKTGDTVTGAIAVGRDGEEYEISAKAFIVASGGFSDNPEMLKKYTGYTYTGPDCDGDGNITFLASPNSQLTGDGQTAVWEVGGALGSVGICGPFLVPGPHISGNATWITYNEVRVLQEQPYLWVNQEGKRFCDEELTDNHPAMTTAIANQTGRCSYLIFDDETIRHMEEVKLDHVYKVVFPSDVLTNVRGQLEELVNVYKNKHAFIADSIEALSNQTGINCQNLKETIKNYNMFCQKGHDDEFAKNPKFLHPVAKPKFYALRVYPGAYQTVGGIKINGKCEVIGVDNQVIRGLYAAGDSVAGEVYGTPPIGGVGLTTMSFAQGFISAEAALAHINIK